MEKDVMGRACGT